MDNQSAINAGGRAPHSRSGRGGSIRRMIIKKLRQELQNSSAADWFCRRPMDACLVVMKAAAPELCRDQRPRVSRTASAARAAGQACIYRQLVSAVSNRNPEHRSFNCSIPRRGNWNRSDYEEFALPYTQKIFDAVGTRPPHSVLKRYRSHSESMARSGADVIGIDWRLPIAEARPRVGDGVAIQGDLGPCLLRGPKERMLSRTQEISSRLFPSAISSISATDSFRRRPWKTRALLSSSVNTGTASKI